jgi:hypothetical protein
MSKKQITGLIGAALLFAGVFLPSVSMPFVDSMNYFQNGKADGAIIIILAVISVILVLTKKYKGLYFIGLGSLGVMLFTFFNFHVKQMEREVDGNLFSGLADAKVQTIQLQWGWVILIAGAALIIFAAAMKENSSPDESRRY